MPSPRQRTVQAFIIILTTGWLLTSLLACSGIADRFRGPATFVPITDLKEVAGKWEGRGHKGADLHDDSSWVIVNIKENGSFVAASNSTSDMPVGAGMLRLEAGRLITETAVRHLTITRYERNDVPLLIVEGTARDGAPLRIELKRAK